MIHINSNDTSAPRSQASAEDDARDDDQFVLAPRAALYVAFLEAGNCSDDATVLADFALAHPHILLEDCRPSFARAWAAAR